MHKWVILTVLAVLAVGATAQAETVYFLVAEINPFHNDCYLLALDWPWSIAYARDLIEYGTGPYGTIVIGLVLRSWEGPININRNYLEPGMPAWSWSVCLEDSQKLLLKFVTAGLAGWKIALAAGLMGARFVFGVIRLLPSWVQTWSRGTVTWMQTTMWTLMTLLCLPHIGGNQVVVIATGAGGRT